jgi:hypothetical protein
MGIGASMLWWEEGFDRDRGGGLDGRRIGAAHGISRGDWRRSFAILRHT